jgi:transposase
VDTSSFEMEGSQMPKSRPPDPAEFRRQMVELVRAGRSPDDLAQEFEPSAQSIRNWVAQAERDEGLRRDGLTSDEREELNRLRRENRQLKQGREILKKAAAWFARETGTIPDGQFIEGWYNPHRRHSTIDYQSPINFERRYQGGGITTQDQNSSLNRVNPRSSSSYK